MRYYSSPSELGEKWNSCLQRARQTYFSSPEWHQVILELYHATWLTKLTTKIHYFSIEKGGKAVLGFFGVKKWKGKKVLEFSPLLGPSDYYDFVSGPDTGPDTMQELMKNIASDHKAAQINFAHVKADSHLGTAIQSFSQVQVTKLDCVAIHLPESYESYFSALSKSVRQNIRTAYNRLRKDGQEVEYSLYTKSDIAQIDFTSLKDLYMSRNAYRKEKHGWKTRVFKFLNHPLSREKDMFELEAIKSTDFTLAMLKIKGQTAAYFFGFERHGRIEINRVVINPEFRFYSPGLLLLNEYIKKGIPEGLKMVDLTVGDEKYKFDLGGTVHEILNGKIILDANSK